VTLQIAALLTLTDHPESSARRGRHSFRRRWSSSLSWKDSETTRLLAAPIVSPVKPAQPAAKRGIVGRMQLKLATALKFDQDMKEF
jgi:hypothetical protein